jgi:hypothetical protein
MRASRLGRVDISQMLVLVLGYVREIGVAGAGSRTPACERCSTLLVGGGLLTDSKLLDQTAALPARSSDGPPTESPRRSAFPGPCKECIRSARHGQSFRLGPGYGAARPHLASCPKVAPSCGRHLRDTSRGSFPDLSPDLLGRGALQPGLLSCLRLQRRRKRPRRASSSCLEHTSSR